MYAVAEADAEAAIEIIRAKVAASGELVEDMGRVTDELLSGLHLAAGEFKRV